MFGSATTALILPNKEMGNIMKIAKESLEEEGFLIRRISETIKNESKEQKVGFLPISLGTVVASIFGKTLAGKGVVGVGEGTIRPAISCKIFETNSSFHVKQRTMGKV